MIVPDYWAEARKQVCANGRQITVRRYGWSNTSEADALRNAEERVEEALQRILTGEKLNKREAKVAYNGADGLPIREEVLARHGEQVITRNTYGAHCLNSPNVLFADIDFKSRAPAVINYFLILAALLGLIYGFGLILALISSPVIIYLAIKLFLNLRSPEYIARRRLIRFISKNPSWNIRLYRTPAGYRVLVTHQTFAAKDPMVKTFFQKIAADPVYVRMCINQSCFRARLTAKPWRIGIAEHMRPRPGVWPVRAEKLAIRNQWLEEYEAKAREYAACHYMESLGSGIVEAAVQEVIELHDRESRALETTVALA